MATTVTTPSVDSRAKFLSDAVTMDIKEEEEEEEKEKEGPALRSSTITAAVDENNDQENDYVISKNPTKYGLIAAEDGAEDIDSLPYKKGCYHKIKYRIESFFVVHPRLNALYLLYRSIWPRALVVVDMYTDILIAAECYNKSHTVWFMLSCLFIALPFALVWSVSLRFIQMYLNKLFQQLNTKKSKRLPFIQSMINLLLMLYIFPPIGSLCIALYEVYWVLSDIFNGIKAFLFGTGLIEAEDQQTKAMKAYRRAIEIFSESIPQTLLQLYIFINNDGLQIDPSSLYISLGISAFNLFINFWRFKNEARIHGMSWAEYALSVLQLAEVPITKLVPRLPAIKKGFVDNVNFCGFVFDKESLQPLSEAVNSEKSKLQTIKISIGSLSNLDYSACKSLGIMLKKAGIEVLVSRTSSLLHIKNLFESIDDDSNGYLDEHEFLAAVNTLNCSLKNSTKKQQLRIFRKMAIRRLKKRDRVYFYDFFKQTASFEDKRAYRNDVQFDLTQIDYPLHFVFQSVTDKIIKMKEVGVTKTFYSDQKAKSLNDQSENIWLSNMGKLFQFCSGMECFLDCEVGLNNHIFFSIMDAFYLLGAKSQYPKYYKHVWKQFMLLLDSPEFNKVAFFLQRNQLFKNAEIEQKLKISEVTKPFVKSLKIADFDGINILEYCFMYRNHKETGYHNLCKPFVYLLNAFLKASESVTVSNANYIESLMTEQKSDSLYYLLHGTDFLHMQDCDGHTALHYAASCGLDEVVQFYAQYVFKHASLAVINSNERTDDIADDDEEEENDEEEKDEEENKESEYHWIEDQNYLHSIIISLLSQAKTSPNSATLRSMLESNKIDLSHAYRDKPIHYSIIEMRKQATERGYDNEFLLECMEILDEFGYDWINVKFQNKWNVLQSAAYLNDHKLIVALIKLFENRSTELLSTLLNERGIHLAVKRAHHDVQTPLTIASYKRYFNIVKTLLLCKHQQFEGSMFLTKVCVQHSVKNWSIGADWMRLLYDIIEETNGNILNDRFDDDTKKQLYEKLTGLYKHLIEAKTKTKAEKTTSTSTTDKLLKFFQIDASNKDKIQQTKKNSENEEKSNLDLVKGIILKLEENLNIMESVIEEKNKSNTALKPLKSLSLQFAKCTGHFGKVYSISYNNGCIASAAQDGIVIIWKVEEPKAQKSGLFSTKKRLQTFRKLHTFRSNSAWIMCVALSEGSKKVCYGGLDNMLTVCEIGGSQTDKLEIECANGYMSSFKFMDKVDVKYILATSGDGVCYVFDTEMWINEREPFKMFTIARGDLMRADYYKYSEEKVMIAFCSVDAKLYLADFYSKQEEYYAIISGAESDLNSCAFSPNGKLIATAGDDGNVYIYDIDGLHKRKCIEYDAKNRKNKPDSYMNGITLICQHTGIGEYGITDVVFISDDCLFVCSDNGDTLYVKKLNEDSNEWGFGTLTNNHRSRISCLAADVSNKLLFSGSWDLTIHAHDVNVL